VSINVIQYGLGPIGIETLKVAAQRSSIKLVGAIDIDPNKVGKDLGELAGLESLQGLRVTDSLAAVMARSKPDVALLTTSSRLAQALPQLDQLMEAGVNVVSSCEELLFPWDRQKELAERVDSLAQRHNVRVLGTGINPGFVLDELVVTMASVCSTVSKIEAKRILDAGKRRGPLQKKIGAGMSEAEFRDLASKNALGHVGMAESVAYVAAGLGWKVDSILETIDPVLCRKDTDSAVGKVSKGQVAGLRMTGVGKKGGAEVITLELQMYVGAEQPGDEIFVQGEPSLRTTIEGGIPGDIATAAKLISSIPRVLQGDPGLLKPLSLGFE
jgi:4-hydroxy-tetrahydrodipicolinate reductase